MLGSQLVDLPKCLLKFDGSPLEDNDLESQWIVPKPGGNAFHAGMKNIPLCNPII